MSGKRTLGSLLVNVGANTQGLSAAMDRAKNQVGAFGSKVGGTASRARGAFGSMGQAASSAGSRISGMMGLGALGMAGAAGGAGMAIGATAAVTAGMFKFAKGGASAFSPESMRKESELEIQNLKLDAEFAEKFPTMTMLSDNWWDMAKTGMRQGRADYGIQDETDLLRTAAIGGLSGVLGREAFGGALGLAQVVGDAFGLDTEMPSMEELAHPNVHGPALEGLGNLVDAGLNKASEITGIGADDGGTGLGWLAAASPLTMLVELVTRGVSALETSESKPDEVVVVDDTQERLSAGAKP